MTALDAIKWAQWWLSDSMLLHLRGAQHKVILQQKDKASPPLQDRQDAISMRASAANTFMQLEPLHPNACSKRALQPSIPGLPHAPSALTCPSSATSLGAMNTSLSSTIPCVGCLECTFSASVPPPPPGLTGTPEAAAAACGCKMGSKPKLVTRGSWMGGCWARTRELRTTSCALAFSWYTVRRPRAPARQHFGGVHEVYNGLMPI
eukprot:1144571-Pelagomonas_calceolata.AAC.2